MSTGDSDHGDGGGPGGGVDDVEAAARQAQARATALLEDDIRNLADQAISNISRQADEAIAKARQVEALMQRLADLLERSDDEP
jgi:hypothetical protein